VSAAFVLEPRGPFSLGAAARFAEGFPATDGRRDGDALAFAWAVDGDWRPVAVTLTEDGERIHGVLRGADDPALEQRARRDVGRILSLDVDGTAFAALGAADPVVGRLQSQFPGLRPVLFWTPYEAAAWTIIGQRIRMAQAARIKQRLADELGETAGGLPAFPAPERLAALEGTPPGLTAQKADRLRALGAAAAAGELDRDRLRALTTDEVDAALQSLPGIGPFASALVRVRGVGDPDVFPVQDRRLNAAVRTATGLPAEAPDADVLARVEAWRPYRAWVALLLRAGAA
jgi:DNA-3-methyladenine glycosylase II